MDLLDVGDPLAEQVVRVRVDEFDHLVKGWAHLGREHVALGDLLPALKISEVALVDRCDAAHKNASLDMAHALESPTEIDELSSKTLLNRPLRRKVAHKFPWLNGVRIRWSDYGGGIPPRQDAWRCIKRGRLTVWIDAGGSSSGDNGLNTPQQRIDAMLLVRMVAHVKYIG